MFDQHVILPIDITTIFYPRDTELPKLGVATPWRVPIFPGPPGPRSDM
jgi:hypothetical protein